MTRETWLDGFNFFHHWESTRGLLAPDSGYDIVKAIDRSLRILARHLGGRARDTVVFLDGGLGRDDSRLGNLRIRHSGPGRKADDRMADDLYNLGDNASLVTAVSNDRELLARLRGHGSACLGVGEYLATLENAKGRAPGPKSRHGKAQPGHRGEAAEIMRQKCRTLSASEVQAWLEYFGEDDPVMEEPQ